jgi:hypothetical protein
MLRAEMQSEIDPRTMRTVPPSATLIAAPEPDPEDRIEQSARTIASAPTTATPPPTPLAPWIVNPSRLLPDDPGPKLTLGAIDDSITTGADEPAAMNVKLLPAT